MNLTGSLLFEGFRVQCSSYRP